MFHRSSRTEYARIILDVWRNFFANPLQEQPSAREVTPYIDKQLRSRRTFAGGLEKAEMPEAVSRLVRFLSDLERGTATSLGGAVSAMLSARRAARDNPEVNASAVRDTAQRAEDFLWRLRSLVVGLRRLEGSILEQRSAGAGCNTCRSGMQGPLPDAAVSPG